MKAKYITSLVFSLSAALLPVLGLATFDVNQDRPGTQPRRHARTAAACLPATSTAELNINNVRCLLHNGGDMWWDLVGQPRYEVPRVSNPAAAKHSMFAGSLWIGGFDGSGQLRIAAQTYRQRGNDFFPGPIRVDGTASTDADICKKWDIHYKVSKAEVDAFKAEFTATGTVDLNNFPSIRNWPGNNPDWPEFERILAPFVDLNNNNVYEPQSGEYPDIVGDQAIWWVVNDKGDIHTETTGEQIGVEIQMLAFAFSTSNAVNNMTFYRQTVINRSTNVLTDTYIAQWCDADLGFYADDFVGCDTVRGLGFCYNGDGFDDEPTGYGNQPPAIGIDFFQGPVADVGDGLDNDRDGLIDETEADGSPERMSMSKFIYYNNDFSVRGNPTVAQHFYGYMAGFWRNGSPVVDDRSGNGNGFPDPGETFTGTAFMYPDFPNTCGPGFNCPAATPIGPNPWDEVCADNNPFDRRFNQSAGPFTLQPGARNEVVVGAVWARDISAGSNQIGSLCALLQADDIAQALFDSNFDLLDGPDAPDMKITEMDQQLVLNWSNNMASNNALENYREIDPVLQKEGVSDPVFDFEGYLVYQLIDQTVSASELTDASRARVIAQCDIRNGVATIVNRTETSVGGQLVVNDQVMVEGDDDGLFYSFRVTEDVFSTSTDRSLVNYRLYYFMIVAYAFNDTTSDGRRFLPGNANVRRYEGMPHKTEFENFGMNLNSAYGTGTQISRIAGQGSGGQFLRITPESEQAILQNTQANPVYAGGAGPIQVKVVDPKLVKNLTYRVAVVRNHLLEEVEVLGANNQVEDTMRVYADWILLSVKPSGAQDTVFRSRYAVYASTSDTVPTPLVGTERVIPGHGISIAVFDAPDPGFLQDDNGVVGAELTFADPQKAWLTGMPDVDNVDLLNWIRSADTCSGTCPGTGANCINGVCQGGADYNPNFLEYAFENTYQAFRSFDPRKNFQTLLNGTWAPYILSASFNTEVDVIGPRLRILPDNPISPNNLGSIISEFINLPDLPNVDVVITPDPTKWSRCLVVETSPSRQLSGAGAVMAPKWQLSMQQASGNGCNLAQLGGSLDPNWANDNPNYAISYFPGYAINLDTGERLNLFFGESSWHQSENGRDMLWNPTAGFGNDGRAMGGRHYVYVTNQRYDGCASLERFKVKNQAPNASGTGYIYNQPGGGNIRLDSIFKHVAWVSIPLLSDPVYEFDSYCNIPTEARVALRVNNAFAATEPSVFEFSTGALAAELNNKETARRSVMEDINIVPNPYYGRSGTGRGSFETNQLDTRVKITNLPQLCTIRILTLNGQLIRTYRKDSDEPDQEWDLKNDYGVPVASGLYILHIDAGGLGEKVLKFFCVLPELDLNAY